MTTEELIARARMALTEGPDKPVQPRVAVNYMKQALRQVDAHRKELAPHAWQVRKFGEAFQSFARDLHRAMKTAAEGLAPFAREIEATQRKIDYTLVGDN